LPEAAMVIGVGMLAGYLIHLVVGRRMLANAAQQDISDDDAADQEQVEIDLAALLSFSPEIFFIFLLPPIIFNTGLRMGALFFRHITPIVMFAVLGTAISAISTAVILWIVVQCGLTNGFQPSLAELLTFGALISSTDPVSTLAVFQAKRVDPRLFYLCFGESVLNDALAIVLFYSFGKFVSREHDPGDVVIAFAEFFVDLFLNSIGSLVLGCFGGAFAAFLFKQIDMRHNRLSEISVLILLMYIPFLIAEILHLSGIVTILFTGITANRYVVPNLSAITKVNGKQTRKIFFLWNFNRTLTHSRFNQLTWCFVWGLISRKRQSFWSWVFRFSVWWDTGTGPLSDGVFWPVWLVEHLMCIPFPCYSTSPYYGERPFLQNQLRSGTGDIRHLLPLPTTTLQKDWLHRLRGMLQVNQE
jgi:hypothetical protein